jgi:hypothetical protein
MNSKIKDAGDLAQQYRTILNAPLLEMIENVAGEFVKIIIVSDWVQFAFIRFDDNSTKVRIEVEISLPTNSCGESLSESSSQLNLLEGMMTHILYIKNLLKIGFNLSVIKEDCLWVASYLMSKDPSLEVFEALVPPIVY